MLKEDLQREHFKLGHNQDELKTTNMDLALHVKNSKGQNHQFKNEKEKEEHAKMKQNMRGHHFSYGATQPNYSSMAKSQFKEYDLKTSKE